ncbi:EXS (ERD1/XPR1/SYG1) family protein [Artemisia annua]|uniref:EXS (ERD1/XPR1/SYG1) family protein n=1 Tax=Artemisia annua TaxID=35608 RepID=A0A2U1LX93_ARTAN|nr:EXS (ERD1/XPR1/SYG1) family protein [Artemisia annua]
MYFEYKDYFGPRSHVRLEGSVSNERCLLQYLSNSATPFFVQTVRTLVTVQRVRTILRWVRGLQRNDEVQIGTPLCRLIVLDQGLISHVVIDKLLRQFYVMPSRLHTYLKKAEVEEAEGRLKVVFVEFSHKLHLLKHYSYANLLTFSKILKKYEKVAERRAIHEYQDATPEVFGWFKDGAHFLVRGVHLSLLLFKIKTGICNSSRVKLGCVNDMLETNILRGVLNLKEKKYNKL